MDECAQNSTYCIDVWMDPTMCIDLTYSTSYAGRENLTLRCASALSYGPSNKGVHYCSKNYCIDSSTPSTTATSTKILTCQIVSNTSLERVAKDN